MTDRLADRGGGRGDVEHGKDREPPASREDDESEKCPDQAAVEGQPTHPDHEEVCRVVGQRPEFVLDDIQDAPAHERGPTGPDSRVGDDLGLDAAPAALTLGQPDRDRYRADKDEPVPALGNTHEAERDGVDIDDEWHWAS